MFAFFAAIAAALAILDVIGLTVMLEWWLMLIALQVAFGWSLPWGAPPWTTHRRH